MALGQSRGAGKAGGGEQLVSTPPDTASELVWGEHLCRVAQHYNSACALPEANGHPQGGDPTAGALHKKLAMMFGQEAFAPKFESHFPCSIIPAVSCFCETNLFTRVKTHHGPLKEHNTKIVNSCKK